MDNAANTIEQVRKYIHPAGAGLKIYPAQASSDSFIDDQSAIEGETEIYSTSLRGSVLKDTFAFGARVHSSAVAASRLADSIVVNSDIESCDIVGAEAGGCRLIDCHIHIENGHSPRLSGVNLAGVRVAGEVEMRGPFGMDAPGAHVHAGVWTRAPRHILLIGQIHVAVVECTDGRAHMGCACRPVKFWLERGPRLGRRFGWTEEQIESCRQFLVTLN